MKPTLIAVVGFKDRGKTSVAVRIIKALRMRGYRVAAVKHAHSRLDFQDRRGSDTYRFASAGADVIVGVSRDTIVTVERSADIDLECLIDYLKGRGVDVVVLEGFKGLVCSDPRIFKVIVAYNAEEVESLLSIPCTPSFVIVWSGERPSRLPPGARLLDASKLEREVLELVRSSG